MYWIISFIKYGLSLLDGIGISRKTWKLATKLIPRAPRHPSQSESVFNRFSKICFCPDFKFISAVIVFLFRLNSKQKPACYDQDKNLPSAYTCHMNNQIENEIEWGFFYPWVMGGVGYGPDCHFIPPTKLWFLWTSKLNIEFTYKYLEARVQPFKAQKQQGLRERQR